MHREPLEPSAADRRALHRGRARLRRRARGVSGRSRRRQPWPRRDRGRPLRCPDAHGDDYYILRQLAARSRNAESEREQRPRRGSDSPEDVHRCVRQPAIHAVCGFRRRRGRRERPAPAGETGAVPAAWAAEALDTAETGESYTDWTGKYYSLDATYCVTDSPGFVTVRRFGMTDKCTFTR